MEVEEASERHEGGDKGEPATLDRSIVAEVLASLAYGELCGARRSEPQPVDHPMDRVFRPLRPDLDGSLRGVANPSIQAK